MSEKATKRNWLREGALVYELYDGPRGRPVNLWSAHVYAESRDIGGTELVSIAKLFAAAPDLYSACNELLAIVRLQNGNLHADTNEIMVRADAALAKATGDQR